MHIVIDRVTFNMNLMNAVSLWLSEVLYYKELIFGRSFMLAL